MHSITLILKVVALKNAYKEVMNRCCLEIVFLIWRACRFLYAIGQDWPNVGSSATLTLYSFTVLLVCHTIWNFQNIEIEKPRLIPSEDLFFKEQYEHLVCPWK